MPNLISVGFVLLTILCAGSLAYVLNLLSERSINKKEKSASELLKKD